MPRSRHPKSPDDPSRDPSVHAQPPLEVEGEEDVDVELELDPEADASAEGETEGPAARVFLVRKEMRKRLDVYLHQRLKGISRSKVQQLIDLGGVTVNGKPPKASTVLRPDDRVEVILPPPAIRTILPEPIPLDVLYEDPYIIVINKQADLIVHPARGRNSGTLVNGLAHHFKVQQEQAGGAWREWNTRGFKDDAASRAQTPPGEIPGLSQVGVEDLRPGIIHRLDRFTTGAMVVAKSDQAHWQIARQFEDRKTVKAYLALVHGNFDEPEGRIHQPLGKHPTIREAYAIRNDSSGRDSLTLYRVREQYRGFSLVELELKTGRTHQIRVHLSYIGHPIVGDIVYGGEPVGTAELDAPPIAAGSRRHVTFARTREEGMAIEAAAKARTDLILAHPALHAAFLRFTHPMTQQAMTFIAPMRAPMSDLLARLRQRPAVGPVAAGGWWVDLASILPSATGG